MRYRRRRTRHDEADDAPPLAAAAAALLGAVAVASAAVLLVGDPVPATRWASTDYAALRRPARVEGSPATAWRALAPGAWPATGVAARLPDPVPCQSSSGPFFMYYDTDVAGLDASLDPADAALGLGSARAVDLPRTAFAAALAPGSGEYVYYTEALTDAALLRDVPGWEGLLVGDAGAAPPDEAAPPPALSLWVGSAGVVTQTHYDAPHNIFVQKFTLWPPEGHRLLYLFPELHVRARKARVVHVDGELSAAAAARFPRAADGGARGVDVEVGPGDVLYVPPFWMHRVETLEASVSLNLFAPSEEAARVAELLGLPLPFDDEAALRAGLPGFLAAALGGEGALRAAAGEVLHLRYSASPDCGAAGALGTAATDAVQARAAEAAALLARLRALGGEGMAELATHQYLELLANFASGGDPRGELEAWACV